MWNHEPIDWLDRLKQNKIVSRSTHSLFRNCIDKKGFVTGGFGRSLACTLLAEKGLLKGRTSSGAAKTRWSYDGDSWDRLYSYCGIGYFIPTREEKRQKSNFWKNGRGDVDFFFPTREVAFDAIQDSRNYSDVISCEPTLAGFGEELVIKSGMVVQLIHKLHGDPISVIQTFDLANPKVYLDKTGLHWTDDWAVLEDKRLLGIDSYEKPNLLWRVYKWFRKHTYMNFREGDHSKFVDSLLLTAQKANIGELIMWDKKISVSEVQKRGKIFLDLMTPSDLLKASLIYDGYHQMDLWKYLNPMNSNPN